MTSAPRASRPVPAVRDVLAAETLRYSQVWEDSALLEEGLGAAARGAVLSIASGGCNALALLAAGASRVLAVDVNRLQAALLVLKVAAIRSLAAEESAAFFGYRDHADRLALYERIRPALPDWAADLWDARAGDLARGVATTGRLEAYIGAFQREVFADPLVRPVVDRLLESETLAAQADAFGEIATPELRERFVAYYGRDRMAREGRHASQFRWVDMRDPGRWFWRRFTWVCTRLPARDNFYLEYFLTSRFRSLESAPVWLRPSARPRLRARLRHLAIEVGDLGEIARASPRAFDGANLSDIFEYLSPDETSAMLERIAGALRPGGRICYWNLLVVRRSPPSLAARLSPLAALSRALTRRDRSWFYRAFRADEVIA